MGGLEAGGALIPSGYAVGRDIAGADLPGTDWYVYGTPRIGFWIGENVSLVLGAQVPFLITDSAPANKPGRTYFNLIPMPNFDQRSDYGQIIESFRLGHEGGWGQLYLGAVSKYTLGMGHILVNYQNRLNASYLPAAGTGMLDFGPVHIEAFASDILDGRILAGEIAWDIGKTFSKRPRYTDHWKVAIQAAYDFGKQAGLPYVEGMPYVEGNLTGRGTPPLTLGVGGVEGKFALWPGRSVNLSVVGAWGARIPDSTGNFQWGYAAGLQLDTIGENVGFSLQLEARNGTSGYRIGMFGSDYELARFSATGYGFRASNGVPVAGIATDANPGAIGLNVPWSGYINLKLWVAKQFSVEVGDELFISTIRNDTYASLDLDILDHFLFLTGRATFISNLGGLNNLTSQIAPNLVADPRMTFSLSLRMHILPYLFVSATGGTSIYPQASGLLLPGYYGSLGLGFFWSRT